MHVTCIAILFKAYFLKLKKKNGCIAIADDVVQAICIKRVMLQFQEVLSI